jgi:hypothetical protein
MKQKLYFFPAEAFNEVVPRKRSPKLLLAINISKKKHSGETNFEATPTFSP